MHNNPRESHNPNLPARITQQLPSMVHKKLKSQQTCKYKLPTGGSHVLAMSQQNLGILNLATTSPCLLDPNKVNRRLQYNIHQSCTHGDSVPAYFIALTTASSLSAPSHNHEAPTDELLTTQSDPLATTTSQSPAPTRGTMEWLKAAHASPVVTKGGDSVSRVFTSHAHQEHCPKLGLTCAPQWTTPAFPQCSTTAELRPSSEVLHNRLLNTFQQHPAAANV